jgi:hypothetical protein
MCLRAAHAATGVEVAGGGSTSEQTCQCQWALSQIKEYILRTPALHDAREKCLFWIVCNVGTEPIDDPSEMAIWETNHLGSRHAGFE